MPESSVAFTPGSGRNIDVFTLPNGRHRERVKIEEENIATWRASTFVTPGNGTNQVIFAVQPNYLYTDEIGVSNIVVDSFWTNLTTLTTAPPTVKCLIANGVQSGLPDNSDSTQGALVDLVEERNIFGYDKASAIVRQAASAENTLASGFVGWASDSISIISQEYAGRANSTTTNLKYEQSDKVEMLSEPVWIRSDEIDLSKNQLFAVTIDLPNSTALRWSVSARIHLR